jgi:hypothetical protein
VNAENQTAAFEKCDKCPVGRYTKDASALRCEEVSEASMYLNERVVTTKSGDVVVEYTEMRCPPLSRTAEATCGDGVLIYHTGYWHDGLLPSDTVRGTFSHPDGFILSSDHRFYTCPCQNCCDVNNKTGSIQCLDGTDGLLCTICSEGYFRNGDRTCSPCTDEHRNMLPMLLLVSFALSSFVIYWSFNKYGIRRLPKQVQTRLLSAKVWAYRFAADSGLVCMIKIVCSFYQVLLLLGDIYDVPFPREYVDFIWRWFAVFEFDFLQLARVDCVRKVRAVCVDCVWGLWGLCGLCGLYGLCGLCVDCVDCVWTLWIVGRDNMSSFPRMFLNSLNRIPSMRQVDFYEMTMITCGLMLVLELGALLAEICPKQSMFRPRFITEGGLKQLQAVCLVTAYFLYSPVSSSIFQVFNCRKIGNGSFLQRDYSLSCDVPAHGRMTAFSSVMALLVAVGLPLLYFVVLYRHRDELRTGKLKALEFFVRDYVREWRYWEVRGTCGAAMPPDVLSDTEYAVKTLPLGA